MLRTRVKRSGTRARGHDDGAQARGPAILSLRLVLCHSAATCSLSSGYHCQQAAVSESLRPGLKTDDESSRSAEAELRSGAMAESMR